MEFYDVLKKRKSYRGYDSSKNIPDDVLDRIGQAVNLAFGCPLKKAFGFMAASPAAIGMVIADKALKDSGVELIT